jgi:hypothetical protein
VTKMYYRRKYRHMPASVYNPLVPTWRLKLSRLVKRLLGSEAR